VDSSFKAAARSNGLRRDLNDPLVVKPLFELLLRMRQHCRQTISKNQKMS